MLTFADFELAFLVDAVLALDPLLAAVAPVAAYTHNESLDDKTSQS